MIILQHKWQPSRRPEGTSLRYETLMSSKKVIRENNKFMRISNNINIVPYTQKNINRFYVR